MSVWLNIAQMVLALAVKLMDYLDKKQLIDAGQDKQKLKAMQEASDEIRRARAARKSIRADSKQLRNDPHNRDQRGL